MIHEAECHIVIQGGVPGFTKAEPPIPTDAQIEEVFPGWKLKAEPFIKRCCAEEGKSPYNIGAGDLFRYGMKFMISEATKLC